jgi:hypothetical protein
MEGVLKGLEGKTLTKKSLFDFLADIDLDELFGKKPLNTELPKPVSNNSGIKCPSCSRTFTVENSRRRHYKRFPDCAQWIKDHPEALIEEKIEKPVKERKVRAKKVKENKIVEDGTLKIGLHLLIVDILEKSVGCDDDKKKCRWCDTKFVNMGNINKHLNNSSKCNKMAFEEFKKHINSI